MKIRKGLARDVTATEVIRRQIIFAYYAAMQIFRLFLRAKQGQEVRWLLDFNVLSTAQGHPGRSKVKKMLFNFP